ncbi:PAS domain-containing protein [Thermodesulfobacteriota bacterium]
MVDKPSINTPAPGSAGTYDERLRAERRYRSLLEFLPYPVCVFGLDSTVTYVNPAFTKVLKWTLDELEGKRIPFVPDHFLEETRQGMKRLFQEKIVHEVETKRLTKDGRILDLIFDAAVFMKNPMNPRVLWRFSGTLRAKNALTVPIKPFFGLPKHSTSFKAWTNSWTI